MAGAACAAESTSDSADMLQQEQTATGMNGIGSSAAISGRQQQQAGQRRRRRQQAIGAFTYLPGLRSTPDSTSSDASSGSGSTPQSSVTSSQQASYQPLAATEDASPGVSAAADAWRAAAQPSAAAAGASASESHAARNGRSGLSGLGGSCSRANRPAHLCARAAAAPEWFVLRRLFDAHASALNIVHVTAIATRLVQLLASPPRVLLAEEWRALAAFNKQLQGRALCVVAGANGRTATALLHSLAKLQDGLQVCNVCRGLGIGKAPVLGRWCYGLPQVQGGRCQIRVVVMCSRR